MAPPIENPSSWAVWLLGFFASLVSIGGGAWLASLHRQMAEIVKTQSGHGESIAALKATTAGTESHLTRIEDKLDRIAERFENYMDKQNERRT